MSSISSFLSSRNRYCMKCSFRWSKDFFFQKKTLSKPIFCSFRLTNSVINCLKNKNQFFQGFLWVGTLNQTWNLTIGLIKYNFVELVAFNKCFHKSENFWFKFFPILNFSLMKFRGIFQILLSKNNILRSRIWFWVRVGRNVIITSQYIF